MYQSSGDALAAGRSSNVPVMHYTGCGGLCVRESAFSFTSKIGQHVNGRATFFFVWYLLPLSCNAVIMLHQPCKTVCSQKASRTINTYTTPIGRR